MAVQLATAAGSAIAIVGLFTGVTLWWKGGPLELEVMVMRYVLAVTFVFWLMTKLGAWLWRHSVKVVMGGLALAWLVMEARDWRNWKTHGKLLPTVIGSHIVSAAIILGIQRLMRTSVPSLSVRRGAVEDRADHLAVLQATVDALQRQVEVLLTNAMAPSDPLSASLEAMEEKAVQQAALHAKLDSIQRQVEVLLTNVMAPSDTVPPNLGATEEKENQQPALHAEVDFLQRQVEALLTNAMAARVYRVAAMEDGAEHAAADDSDTTPRAPRRGVTAESQAALQAKVDVLQRQVAVLRTNEMAARVDRVEARADGAEHATERDTVTTPRFRRPQRPKMQCPHCGVLVYDDHQCWVVNKKITCYRCGNPNHVAMACKNTPVGGMTMKMVQGEPGEETIQRELQKWTELWEKIRSRPGTPSIPPATAPPEPEQAPQQPSASVTEARTRGRRPPRPQDDTPQLSPLEPGEIVDVEMFTPEEREKIRRVLRVLPEEGFPLAAVTRRA